MKFGHLIECSMRKKILKIYRVYGGEASSRPFYKKCELTISFDQQSELL